MDSSGEDRARIVHRDREILVLHKPTGLATTSPSGGDCLVARAARLDPKAPRLHPISRLDAEVTGLVTFARSRVANEELMDARRTGHYRRLYVALVQGVPAAASGEWDASIGMDPRDPRKRVAVPAPDAETGDDDEGQGDSTAKTAHTRYQVAAATDDAAWLWLWPGSGRTHQLRVHASHAGVPMLGDVHYGGPRRTTLPNGRVVLHRRVMLHCAALQLPDIANREPTLMVHDPVPEDFLKSWTSLGGRADVGADLRAALNSEPGSDKP